MFGKYLTEKLLPHALGRGLEYYDKCAVDKIVTQTMRQGGTFRAMIEAIVISDPFQKRSGLEEQRHE